MPLKSASVYIVFVLIMDCQLAGPYFNLSIAAEQFAVKSQLHNLIRVTAHIIIFRVLFIYNNIRFIEHFNFQSMFK